MTFDEFFEKWRKGALVSDKKYMKEDLRKLVEAVSNIEIQFPEDIVKKTNDTNNPNT